MLFTPFSFFLLCVRTKLLRFRNVVNHQCAGYLLIVVAIGLNGCVGVPRLPAVPEGQGQNAQIEGMPGIRYVLTGPDGARALLTDVQYIQSQESKAELNAPAYYLSISGGGDNGAFGAGLLAGWTKRGDRPKFNLVTGISTGALIAPFAFLGPSYDSTLQELYTQTSAKNIYKARNIFVGLDSDSLASDKPLQGLIDRYIDFKFLLEVKKEYQVNHRMLLIGTTNLDSGAAVIWNMTKIAAIGTPEALTLFKRVMLASTSVPAFFPPVMFDVLLNGGSYQEMHVDGGASSQVFLFPRSAIALAKKLDIHGPAARKAYVIRNDRLGSTWADTDRWTVSIAMRSIEHIIQTQGFGDLFRIYITSKQDGVDFNLAYIDSGFNFPHKEEFDTEYMSALFNYAQAKAIAGDSWISDPAKLDRLFGSFPD